MRHDLLSSVDAQDKETSGHQVSSADLDVVEFYWKNDQLDVDGVFRTGIDTQFSPTAFDDLEIGGSAQNPILLDEEEDKETLLLQQHQSLRRQHNPLHCWEVGNLEQE